MKITLTASLGNIGSPLARNLISKGHSVTIISTDPKKESAIEALGAEPAIGSVEDAEFLTAAFSGSDAVYLMEPPVDFFDKQLDIEAYYGHLARNFVKAVLDSRVQHVVHLSSIGAHTNKGNGMLHFHHLVENTLRELPGDISLTHVRALAIYYNLQSFVPVIKYTGKISANYGADDVIAWVSPIDIANAIAEELVLPAQGRKFRYVASEELSCNETASILGTAIGIPDLKWEVISDEQQQAKLIAIGMAPNQAAGLVEMNAAMHTGELFKDYQQHRPSAFGKVKMSDYAQEFAKAYNA
jgi:uncharacterized protein YbjT (DUF2867 family)